MFKNDQELFDVVKSELYTPVVGDILDGLGLYHQFLPAGIAPIQLGDKLVGRAMPVVMIDVFGPQKKPFGLLTEALDQLEEGDVYLASGGEQRCAYWGELLTATAKKRGAAGAVINGYYRDSVQVMKQDFPVFSRGRYAQDSSVRTQVTNFRCPIEIGNVWIEPEDLIFGDLDGVLIIPQKHIDEVVEKSLEKAHGEKTVRQAIEGGMTATAAFDTYGIL
jgi:Demethylmenaquinone methyltransferase